MTLPQGNVKKKASDPVRERMLLKPFRPSAFDCAGNKAVLNTFAQEDIDQ